MFWQAVRNTVLWTVMSVIFPPAIGLRLIPLTQAPLYVVSEGGRAWGARFGAPSGGARTHAGGVPERISR